MNFKTEQKRIMGLFQGATIVKMFNYESGFPTGYCVLYCINTSYHVRHYIMYDQDARDPGYYEIHQEQFEAREKETIKMLKILEEQDDDLICCRPKPKQ